MQIVSPVFRIDPAAFSLHSIKTPPMCALILPVSFFLSMLSYAFIRLYKDIGSSGRLWNPSLDVDS